MPSDPVFSIVVPTFARPEHLARCLRSLAALGYPRGDYEVIVVDDGPSPETAATVQHATATLGIAITSLAQRRQGPAKARNAGARAARGLFVAFTDDDCTPRPDWLTGLERSLRAGGRRVVGGATVNALPDLVCSAASQLLVDYLYTYHHDNATAARFFTSNNFAVAAEGFRDAGGFDETFPLAAGEDREFCERWSRLGGQLVQADDAVVEHWHRLTVRRFLRQHFNYGRGAHFLQASRVRRDPSARPGLPKRESWRFYTGMIRFPFGRTSPARAVQLSALLALTQAAYITGYFFQRSRRP